MPNGLGRLTFPDGSDGKESAYNAGDLGSIPGSGRSPRGGEDHWGIRHQASAAPMKLLFIPTLSSGQCFLKREAGVWSQPWYQPASRNNPTHLLLSHVFWPSTKKWGSRAGFTYRLNNLVCVLDIHFPFCQQAPVFVWGLTSPSLLVNQSTAFSGHSEHNIPQHPWDEMGLLLGFWKRGLSPWDLRARRWEVWSFEANMSPKWEPLSMENLWWRWVESGCTQRERGCNDISATRCPWSQAWSHQ